MKKALFSIWVFSLFMLLSCSESKKDTEKSITGFEISKNIIQIEPRHDE